jgi:dihydropteroate synthase
MRQHRLLFNSWVPQSQKIKEGYVLQWSGTVLMGILNVTPDSFSDGGKFVLIDAAIKQATTMLEQGVKIIDLGGESSRPGAEPVSAKQELERVLPIIKLLSQLEVVISIDTCKPEVAFEALKAGAHLVNDITGLRNPEMLEVCADAGVPAVIMHMQGEPQSMQKNPEYKNVCQEVFGFLQDQAELALSTGLPSVMLDPGIGFGKSLEHNLELLRNLNTLTQTGFPVLIGASRKRMIDKIATIPEASSRDPGSVAIHLHAASQGVAMLRVHNTYAHAQALKVWQAIYS